MGQIIEGTHDHLLPAVSLKPMTLRQILVCLTDCAPGNLVLLCHLANAWQGDIGLQSAGGDQEYNLLRELLADRNFAALVDVNPHWRISRPHSIRTRRCDTRK